MTNKSKHLTLRPNEVPRFLRPSGLVVIPCKARDINGADFSTYGKDAIDAAIRHHCPLGGPGTQWVGREKWRLGGAFTDTKLSEFHDPACVLLSHVHYAADDIEEHFAGQYRSSTSMPAWASRIRKTTERVELRRVKTIALAEVIEAGFTMRDGHSLEDVACGWHEPFAAEFNARYPEAWDRDDYAWFVFCTNTH